MVLLCKLSLETAAIQMKLVWDWLNAVASPLLVPVPIFEEVLSGMMWVSYAQLSGRWLTVRPRPKHSVRLI